MQTFIVLHPREQVINFQECQNWQTRRSGGHQKGGGGEQKENDEKVQKIALDICKIITSMA